MATNPYQTPTETQAATRSPIRLIRARRVLFTMAIGFVATSTYEVLNYNLYQGWQSLPWQVCRLILPLVLIALIWRGHPWARYALAVYCMGIVWVNSSMLNYFPRMLQEKAFNDIGFCVLLFGVHFVTGVSSPFASSITGLMNFREDERLLAQTRD